MDIAAQPRRDYEQTCRELQTLGWLEPGSFPPLPRQSPKYDDEEPLGVTFFRTRVSGDFSNMTLPRTFFGRSEISSVSFRNTDLSESTLCWNDFIAVDFSHCCLRANDLRASEFSGVNFTGSDLRDADLRRSKFADCDFTDANLHGAKLTRRQAAGLRLSVSQWESVAWQNDEGEKPGGG